MQRLFAGNGFSPFDGEPHTRGLISNRLASFLSDTPNSLACAKAQKTPCLHFSLLLTLGKYFTRFNPVDFGDLLERLAALIPGTRTSCYGWALLSNHAHLLFRIGEMPLSNFMRRLLTGYVVSFNQRYRRHGPLFQNRFKSIICEEDVYLKELVRYIHLNPLRAGVVTTLSQLNTYDYCGHSTLMGTKKRQWQDTQYVLGYFGKRLSGARQAYYSYVKAGERQRRGREGCSVTGR